MAIRKYFALPALILAVVACQKQEEFETTREVVFSAATNFQNGPATRTEYASDAGDLNVITNGKERINWVSGDQVRINNVTGSQIADYTVSAPESSTDEKSVASITANSSSIIWSGTGANTFVAAYPAGAMNATTGAISGTIPADQTLTQVGTSQLFKPDMQKAYMVATATANPSDGNVTLPFNPAMTAFEFNVALATDSGTEVTVTGFEMTSISTPLVGTFTYDASSGNYSCPTTLVTEGTDANNKISVSFGASGCTLQTGQTLKFTVFALPQNLSGLKVKFFLSSGDKTLSLKQSGEWTTFAACKKYRIITPGLPGDEVWTYVIEPIPNIVTYGHNTESDLGFTIKSYKYKNGDQSTKVDVPWSAVVTAATGTDATTSNLTITDPTGTGSGTGVANSANITEAATGQGGAASTLDAAIAKLRTNPAKGSSSAPYDLSMYDIYGVAHNQETANCYVINSPGFYKFPLVYGNARKNGANNTNAYHPTAATNSNTYLTPFLNSNNSGITSPYILDDMNISASNVNVAIVWQDVPEGSEILDNAQCSIINEDHGYIGFEISKNTIRPGNIVIAVRNGTTILWSWHLWVTEKDLTPIAIKNVSGSAGGAAGTVESISSQILPYNLGWTDRVTASGTAYPKRIWTVQVAHTETGSTATPVTFTVTQIGEIISIEPNIGTSPFYQWGRKDPMLGAKSNTENKDYSAGIESGTTKYQITDGVDPTEQTERLPLRNPSVTSTVYVADAIKHPNYYYYCSNTNSWVGNNNLDTPDNLWNYNITAINKDMPDAKTIYDPCPPGFCVPRWFTFTMITSTLTTQWVTATGTWHGGNYIGRDFPTRVSGTFFMPTVGTRTHNRASLQYVNDWGDFWTTAATDDYTNNRGKHSYAKSFAFRQYGDLACWGYDRMKACGYAIRPVVDQSPSSGGSGSGISSDGNIEDEGQPTQGGW